MATSSTAIGTTPCCGVIERSWESFPDRLSSTGMRHIPGGDYAPDFEDEVRSIRRGICPDCGNRFHGVSNAVKSYIDSLPDVARRAAWEAISYERQQSGDGVRVYHTRVIVEMMREDFAHVVTWSDRGDDLDVRQAHGLPCD